MMTDLPDYPKGPGYRRNSAASKDGARKARKLQPTQHAKVMAAIAQAGAEGIISDDVADKTGIFLNTARARISELYRAGKVAKLPDNSRRMGGCGVRNTVWLLPQFAPPPPPGPQGSLALTDAA